MEPVRRKTFTVRGDYVTAGLIGLLVITVFAGGIFLFKNIAPNAEELPKSSTSPDVLSAVATPQPTQEPIFNQTPVGPTTPVSTPKATPKKTPSPSPSATASATPSTSPSSSPSPTPTSTPADTDPTISLDQPSSDASISGQTIVKATASDPNGDLKSVTLYVDENQKESKTASSSSSSSYEFTWDGSSTKADNPHVIKVEAEDNAGHKKSVSVSVNKQ